MYGIIFLQYVSNMFRIVFVGMNLKPITILPILATWLQL